MYYLYALHFVYTMFNGANKKTSSVFGLEWLGPLLEDNDLLLVCWFFNWVFKFSSYGCGKEEDGILLSKSTIIDSLTPINPRNVPDIIWGRRIFVQVVEVVYHHANVDVRASSIVNTGVVSVQYGFKLMVIRTY